MPDKKASMVDYASYTCRSSCDVLAISCLPHILYLMIF